MQTFRLGWVGQKKYLNSVYNKFAFVEVGECKVAIVPGSFIMRVGVGVGMT